MKKLLTLFYLLISIIGNSQVASTKIPGGHLEFYRHLSNEVKLGPLDEIESNVYIKLWVYNDSIEDIVILRSFNEYYSSTITNAIKNYKYYKKRGSQNKKETHIILPIKFTLDGINDPLIFSEEQKLKAYFKGLNELKLINKHFATEYYLKLDSLDKLMFIQKINEAIEKGAKKKLKIEAEKDSIKAVNKKEVQIENEYDEFGNEIPDVEIKDESIGSSLGGDGFCSEELPLFPLDYYPFILNALNYPKQAIKDNIQGRVYVSYEIEKDGSISNAKIIRGISKELDEEVLRLINAMPNFIPAVCYGSELKKSRLKRPFSFILN